MKFLVAFISIIACTLHASLFAMDETAARTLHDSTIVITDTVYTKDLINTGQTDALLEGYLMKQLELQGLLLNADSISPHTATETITQQNTDSTAQSTIVAHPLCIELIFQPLKVKIDKPKPLQFKHHSFTSPLQQWPPIEIFEEERAVSNLRDNARRYITAHDAAIYRGTFMDLPELDKLHKRGILHNTRRIRLGREEQLKIASIEIEKIKRAKWFYKGSALLQFSQNYVSKNWYKGGNSNIAILGIAEGSIKYDNHKNIQWENTGEWRAGFNSVSGDTLRKISTSDDLLRLQSKLGFKAFNKFYYTGAIEFQTQFFNTFKEINSNTLKSTTFSPIRLNVSLGLDYKPRKDVSIMFAPLSYKFVYVMDTSRIDQTQYSVKSDRQSLNEIGSSIKITYHYQPMEGIQLDSRFYFYTNYQKVEIELELVANFIINRYLSARLSLYPRYDNTVILPEREKAQLQFKEFLSVGFSHKFTQVANKKQKGKH